MRPLFILVEGGPEEGANSGCAFNSAVGESHRLNHRYIGSLLQTDVLRREGFWVASILLQNHAQASNPSDTCWQDRRLEGTLSVEEVFKFVGGERFFFDGVKGRVLGLHISFCRWK